MTIPWNRKIFAVVVGGLAALATTGCQEKFAVELPGAVWASGGAANVFELDSDVFLEGGSAPDGSGRLPDGNYVFAVTDLSGDVLLSDVREVRVDNNDFVKKGDLLIVLDDALEQVKVREATAALEVAKKTADQAIAKAQSQRLVKVLQGAGVSAKAYPAEGKNHTTINNDLGLADDRPTQEMFGFLSVALKK